MNAQVNARMDAGAGKVGPAVGSKVGPAVQGVRPTPQPSPSYQYYESSRPAQPDAPYHGSMGSPGNDNDDDDLTVIFEPGSRRSGGLCGGPAAYPASMPAINAHLASHGGGSSGGGTPGGGMPGGRGGGRLSPPALSTTSAHERGRAGAGALPSSPHGGGGGASLEIEMLLLAPDGARFKQHILPPFQLGSCAAVLDMALEAWAAATQRQPAGALRVEAVKHDGDRVILTRHSPQSALRCRTKQHSIRTLVAIRWPKRRYPRRACGLQCPRHPPSLTPPTV